MPTCAFLSFLFRKAQRGSASTLFLCYMFIHSPFFKLILAGKGADSVYGDGQFAFIYCSL